MFFFEKKNQKTFALAPPRPRSNRATYAQEQKFFASFLQKRRTSSSALLLFALSGTACACFFGVPWQLSESRRDTLATAPANSFAWEASRLAPSGAGPKAVETPNAGDDAFTQARDAAEKAGLTPAQQSLLASMRAAASGQAAFVAGAALPSAIRFYTAGAVAFHQQDWPGAAAFMRGVVALPPAQAASRAVWANYMLGRALVKSGDGAGAAAAFAQTRALAAHGEPDPLGLAAASLGEEAKSHLDAGDRPGAVALYAAQAAAGSDSAVQSLRLVAERIMAHKDQLPDAVRDPLTQRLLVVHALALTGDYLHALHSGGTENEISYDGFFPADELNLERLHDLTAAIAQSGSAGAPLDRLASLSYRLGDYATAKTLAEKAPGPLAQWVRAKLALQAGDQAAAAHFFAAALQAASAADAAASLEPSSAVLLRGETSTMTLARGDFTQAMAVLWPVAKTYWSDVAYLAERVLTTTELKNFVDAHAPAPALWPAPGTAWEIEPVRRIRDLLARRMMRDGDYDTALAYFPPPATDQPDTPANAAAFIRAIRLGHSAFWASDRAAALWQAASLLRHSGMEIMGTELDPDQTIIGGALEHAFGPDPDQLFKQAGMFVPAERARFSASAPVPDARFHYRYRAVDRALEAADLIPARSQAFAAMLCHASGWMLQTNAPDRARTIYRTYVTRGAIVPFATHFGFNCPEPDFAALGATRRRVIEAGARDAVHRHKWALGAGFGVAVVGAIGYGVKRRRK